MRALGISTRSSSSAALASASPATETLPDLRNSSAIWNPTLNTGLSADSESWKTIPMLRPQTSRRSRAGSVSRSRPWNRIEPELTYAGGVSRMPITACPVIVLPDPDSPRIATVSPRRTSNETSRTMSMVSPPVRICTPSERTDSSSRDAGSVRGAGAVGRSPTGVVLGLHGHLRLAGSRASRSASPTSTNARIVMARKMLGNSRTWNAVRR